MNLSIITVVLNDVEGFRKTLDSVAQIKKRGVEWIVVDGYSLDGTYELAVENLELIDTLIQSPPKGIYDAMNKGLSEVNRGFHIFINAGDMIELNVTDILEETIVPVVKLSEGDPVGHFNWKDASFGMPYWHQGMIFKSCDDRFDLSYKVSSDYNYYLNSSLYQKGVQMNSAIGVSFYDIHGYSSSLKSRWKIHKEETEIRRLHSISTHPLYWLRLVLSLLKTFL